MSVSDELRELVSERAKWHCEYCQAPLKMILQKEIDHIIPELAGGKTEPDNLCLACHNCNRSKWAYQEGFDHMTSEHVPLFNPRTQNWYDHFEWDETGTRLVGLTPVGRATIDRLRINRDEIVEARKAWVAAGWHPPQK